MGLADYWVQIRKERERERERLREREREIARESESERKRDETYTVVHRTGNTHIVYVYICTLQGFVELISRSRLHRGCCGSLHP